MSYALSEAVRHLISTLIAFQVVVDTRPEAQVRAAYLPAMPTNFGLPGAGEQSLTPRSVLTQRVDHLITALARVEGLIPVSPNAEGIARVIEAMRRDFDHFGHEHPRVEKQRIERLEEENEKRERALTGSELIPSTPPTPLDPDTLRIGRLQINLLTRRVALDSRSAVIEGPVAFQVFLYIAKGNGVLVKTKDIQESVPGARVGRLDTILKRGLPDWIHRLIPGRSGPNGGYSLQLPEIVRD